MLGWCIPGLSELPLPNRLLSLLAGPFQQFFVFSVISSFFLLSFRVRAGSPSTASREDPAPSRGPAGAGGGGGDEVVDIRRRRRVGRRGELDDKNRLCCVVGCDNGFVQAWEVSLEGERGVGGQPLWSQKVRVVSFALTKNEFASLRRVPKPGQRFVRANGYRCVFSALRNFVQLHFVVQDTSFAEYWSLVIFSSSNFV